MASDLTGQKFTRLLVTGRDLSRKGYFWFVTCDCGVQKSVGGSKLKSGRTRSCGCLRSDLLVETQFRDLTGLRFGRLLVLGFCTRHKNHKQWLTLCDCGEISVVTGSNLVSGRSGSCGCYRNEVTRFLSSTRDMPSLKYGAAAFNALLGTYQRVAKRRGYSFELSKEDFQALTKQPCHYCGCQPSQIFYGKKLNGVYIYNGVDRVDNSLGYTLENCVSSCGSCNKLKHAMTYKDFLSIVERIWTHRVNLNKFSSDSPEDIVS